MFTRVCYVCRPHVLCVCVDTVPVDAGCEMVSVETQTESVSRPPVKSTRFYVGDSSSDEDDADVVDVTTTSTAETQTDNSLTTENQLTTEPHPPRPLDECIAIFNSVV